MSAPCGWSITECPCGTTAWDDYGAAVRAYAEDIACSIIWAATGRRYGKCLLTVQPCTRNTDPLYADWPIADDTIGHYGTNITNGQWSAQACAGGCSCNARCEVVLDGPTSTADIVSVTVDGSLVDAAAYQIHNRSLLVRTDGQCWPTCVNYSSQDSPFEIVYYRGLAIPDAIQHAANRFACEIAKSCTGGDCRLPNRIKSLSRQGVEVQMADLVDVTGRVTTGIVEVDTVLLANNPAGLSAPPAVFTPDIPSPRLIT